MTAKNRSTTTPAPRFLPLVTIAVDLEGPALPSRERVFGIVSNMSESGACLITNCSVPRDASLELSIEDTRSKSRLSVPARVVWCAEKMEPVREIVGFLTGVSFEAGNENIRNLLSSGVFQLVP